jgi:hypothetical protein
MSQANPPSASQTVKPASFKQIFKLHGMILAVVLMWLDYALIHHGLIANVPGAVSGGMVVMLAAAAIAYYFG